MQTKKPRPWARIIGYFLLLGISQLVVTSVVREKIMEFLRKRKNKNKAKKGSLPPLAKQSKYWFASLFLGHLADATPWSSEGGGLMKKIIDSRFHWYKTVEGKDEPTVRAKMLYDDFIFSKDIDIIRSIHGKEDTLFRNSDTIRKGWGVLFPDSITVLTGDKWKRLRRVFVSAMAKLDFELLPPSTNEVLVAGMDRYVTEDVQEVVLWDIFAKITFDSFHKFMYNINFNTISGENLSVLSDLMTIAKCVSDRLLISAPILWKLPTQENKTMYACHKRLLAFVDGYIEERAAHFDNDENYFGQQKFTNLLDAMILATKEENKQGTKLTHKEIRTQLCAAMFGGFDTTTSSLAFINLNLAKNSGCQEKLFEEVKNVDLSKVTKRELDNLPYLNSVIKETMRLDAVAPVLVRIPNQDVVIQDTLLKEGTNIMLDHYSMGQTKKHWKNADDLKEFKPERWFNFTPEKGTFFPFGFGGRQCPGYKVATSQMQVIVAYLSQNYHIEESMTPVKVVCSLGVTVSRDSKIVLRRRK